MAGNPTQSDAAQTREIPARHFEIGSKRLSGTSVGRGALGGTVATPVITDWSTDYNR